MSAKGRFAVVRDGRSSPFADNLFTPEGFALLRTVGAHPLTLSIGNAVADLRVSSDFVSANTSRSGAPDGNGNLWWRTVYRYGFPSIAEQPLVTLIRGSALVDGSTVVSTAQLEGLDGEEGSITVDMSGESFDLLWEFNEYLAAESVAYITLESYASGVLTTTQHKVTIRPANFLNSADNTKGWLPMSTAHFPGAVLNASRLLLGIGEISIYNSQAVFSQSWEAESVTSGFVATWGFDVVGELNCAQFYFGHTEWQVSFDPPIVKTADHKLTIDLSILMANR